MTARVDDRGRDAIEKVRLRTAHDRVVKVESTRSLDAATVEPIRHRINPDQRVISLANRNAGQPIDQGWLHTNAYEDALVQGGLGHRRRLVVVVVVVDNFST